MYDGQSMMGKIVIYKIYRKALNGASLLWRASHLFPCFRLSKCHSLFLYSMPVWKQLMQHVLYTLQDWWYLHFRAAKVISAQAVQETESIGNHIHVWYSPSAFGFASNRKFPNSLCNTDVFLEYRKSRARIIRTWPQPHPERLFCYPGLTLSP